MYICTILSSINLFFLMCLQNWAHWATIFSGFATPILTGVTIIYLIKTFKKQIEANNINKNTQFLLTFQNDLNNLYDRIENLKFYEVENKEGEKVATYYAGRNAIEQYSKRFIEKNSNHNLLLENPFFSDLYFVTATFEKLMNRIFTIEVSEEQRLELIRDVSLLYSSKCTLGMTNLYQLNEKSLLNATVNNTGVNLVYMFGMMLNVHQKYTAMILQYNV